MDERGGGGGVQSIMTNISICTVVMYSSTIAINRPINPPYFASVV